MPAAQNSLYKALIYMFIYAIGYSVLLILVRELSSSFSPFMLAFYRTFFGLVFILPALWKLGFSALKVKRFPLYLFRGVLNITSVLAAFYAVTHIPLADATAYSYLGPIFALVLAVIILKEKIHKARSIAIVISFLSIFLILKPGFQEISLGTIAAIFQAFCFAATLICVKILTKTEDPSIITIYGFLISLPISFIVACFYWQLPDTPLHWIMVISMGLASGIAHLALARAFKIAEMSAVLPMDFTRLVFAVLFGVMVFGDAFDGLTILGGLIILGCSVYIAYRESQIKKHNFR
jgi:drug/metabolite transporter (DMT)-like permease